MADNFKDLNNTADFTAEFDKNDIEANKAMGILAYIGILVVIPIFAAKDSKWAKFHANQGLILCIIGIALSVIGSILGRIPVVGLIVGLVVGLLGLCLFVLMIIGIINAANGQAKELPLVGKFRILK